MTQPGRKIEWLVWAGVGLILLTLLMVAALASLRMRQRAGQPLPVLGQISDFTLTNQSGQVVTLSDLRGTAWVADIIFTRCAGPCPIMTRNLRDVQKLLERNRSRAKLVTFTTDPEFDTPAVLSQYAQRFGADANRWMFLTGDKEQIAKLAVDSLKLTAIEKAPDQQQSPQDLFIHSTIFVLVDKSARLRGIYETVGDGVEPGQVIARIAADVGKLEREP